MSTEPKAHNEPTSGELVAAIKNRFQIHAWILGGILILVPMVVYLGRLPTEEKVKAEVLTSAPTRKEFGQLQIKVHANWEKNKRLEQRIILLLQGLEKRLDRMEQKLDAKEKKE